jgi:hypothetical protein
VEHDLQRKRGRRRARLLPLLIGTLLLGLVAPAVAPAAVPDKWVRWLRIPDFDGARDERSAWVRSVDTIGTQLYVGTEGDGVFTSPLSIGPWLSFNGGLEDQAARKAVREVVSGGGQLYAATSAGLFRSFAAPSSWQPVGQGAGPRKLNMGGIQAIHFNVPFVDQDIVVGTASYGVWYSSDFGENWDKASGLPASESVFDFVQGAALYAAAADGIYASIDGGRSWILTSDGIPPSETVLRVAVAPWQPNLLFASTSGGVYKSTNAGITWEDATGSGDTALGDDHARALLLGPAALRDGRVIVGTQDGAWASRDNGESWGQMSPESALDTDPTDPGPDPLPFGQQILWALGIAPGGPEGINIFAGTQASGAYVMPMQRLLNEARPVITPSSAITVGEKLTAAPGRWTGTRPYFFTYQWRRCSGGSCASIPGAISQTYTPTDNDVTRTIQVTVTGRNIYAPDPNPVDSAQTTSVAVAPAGAPEPVTLQTYPQVTPAQSTMPTPVRGQVFTIANGSWKDGAARRITPDTFTYQWQRCAGSTCVDLPGGDEQSFTTTSADVGYTLQASVTATYLGLSTTKPAGVTGTIVEKRPVATEKPRIVGDAYVGNVLGSSAGAWDAYRPTFTRRWLRCNDEGLQCNPTNPVQTSSTYALTAADKGSRLQLEVTATVVDRSQNRVSVDHSEFSPVITDPPPPPVEGGGPGPVGGGGGGVVVARPSARPRARRAANPGGLRVPKRLGVGSGVSVAATFRGFRKPRYQWYRNGKKIKKATRRTYKITRADRGKKILCKITWTPVRGGKKVVVTTRSFRVPAAPKKKRHR